eukprot:CAMPEP_0180144192 /NCGR_PEP_ID=MMETSP0986-20121125/16737_1 /TAXON_ID=697907 /ORGANISM="non described non described, Strain CCMP2293" /LENGTH=137 /DNA_ID=CAMNT_0022087949 /DNA_START=114 /DNA_END=523 /DNA_ORIENTATION=-
MRGKSKGMTRSGMNSIVASIITALVCMALMSGAMHFYLLKDNHLIESQREKLRSMSDRNVHLQHELLTLNASIGSVVIGLDTVTRSVAGAKQHVQELPTSGAGAAALQQAVATLKAENEHLKAALSLPASSQELALR